MQTCINGSLQPMREAAPCPLFRALCSRLWPTHLYMCMYMWVSTDAIFMQDRHEGTWANLKMSQGLEAFIFVALIDCAATSESYITYTYSSELLLDLCGLWCIFMLVALVH